MGEIKDRLGTQFVPLAKPLLSAGESKQKIEVKICQAGGPNLTYYAIERAAKLEPLFLSSPVTTPELTADEQIRLRELGNCNLSTEDFTEIHHAINRLIVGVAFAIGDQAPKALKARMDKLRYLVTELQRQLGVEEFDPALDDDRGLDETIIGGLETVKHYLGSKIDLVQFTMGLQDVANICKAGAADLAPQVSTRGAKGDRVIYLFLATVFSVFDHAGVSTTLPSNSNKEKLVMRKSTQMSLLCHELCKLAGERGIEFLQRPRSAAVGDTRTARIRFKSYCSMSQGSVVDKLRLVRRNHKVSRQGLQQVTGLKVNGLTLHHQTTSRPYLDRFGTDPVIEDLEDLEYLERLGGRGPA